MKVESVNIGNIKYYDWGKGVLSAIHKKSVVGSLYLTSTGFKEDEQANLKSHGGEDKAVLVIPVENYPFFNIDNDFGFLGENLSISGLDETRLQIGDRLIIGDVVLEVSQPRSPCAKLGELVGKKDFVKHYSSSGRVGFYCRVIQQGNLAENMAVTIVKTDEQSVSISELFVSQFMAKKIDLDLKNIKIALATSALSDAWRIKLSKLNLSN